MAKAVHWQIPFASKTAFYRLDIYDEGFSGTPVSLTGAQNTFTTSEDDSDDFFAPVRTQSGHIRIKNEGLVLLEQLIPATTFDRPVRLINKSASNRIEWQGFLSCETYSQQYISTTTELSIPVIGTLLALDALEVKPVSGLDFASMLKHYVYAVNSISAKVGISAWVGYLYFPTRYYNALKTCFLYQNSFLSSEEVVDMENTVVEAHGISCLELLRMFSTFFGCVIREAGQNIYMTDVQCQGGARQYTYATLMQFYLALFTLDTDPTVSAVSYSSNVNMGSLTYTGNGHTKSIKNGVRRVKLEAKLKDFGFGVELPNVPYGSLVQGTRDGSVYANTNDQSYSLATYKYIQAYIFCPEDPYYPADPTTDEFIFSKIAMLQTLPYDYTDFWDENDWCRYYTDIYHGLNGFTVQSYIYMCAFLSIWNDSNGDEHNGLMVCGFPQKIYSIANTSTGRRLDKRYNMTESEALYTQKTLLPFGAKTGWFVINAHIARFNGATTNYPANPLYNPSDSYPQYTKPGIMMSFKFGNLYWTGTTWSSTFTTFFLQFDAEGKVKSNMNVLYDTEEDGYFLFMPYPYQAGLVEIKIYHEMCGMISAGNYFDQVLDVFIDQMEVKYVVPDNIIKSDRDSNDYMKNTGENFRREETRSVDLASDLNNNIKANMLYYNRNGVTVKLLSLDNVQVRPEVDLLNRMTAYFAASRRKVVLQASHPSSDATPTVQLNGINDGKKYLPLAEERDWKGDKVKLTCYETVNS